MTQSTARRGVVRDVLRNASLCRLEVAWAIHNAAEWAHFVALSIFAFEAGGVTAVGLVGLIRMIPAAAALPLIARAGDRLPRAQVLRLLVAARAVTIGGLALAMAAGAPLWAVALGAAAAATVGAPIRTMTVSLGPTLARTAEEMVAANVVTGGCEGFGVMVGPVLGGLAIALAGPAVATAGAAAAYGIAVLVLMGVRGGTPTGRSADVWGGVRALRDPRPRLVILLFAAQTFVRGVLNVLLVPVAAGFGATETGLGLLNAALGAGGVLGGLAAMRLVGRRRLAVPFGVAVAGWSAPLAVIGLMDHAAVALPAVAAIGGANALLDVTGFTLLQRTVDEDALGRVFGVFEFDAALTVAVGSAAGSALVATLGIHGALIATGVLLPVLAVGSARGLRRIDATVEVPEHALAVLRSTALFAPLSVPVLERLAGRLEERPVERGEVVVREGERGDSVYLVASGTYRVTVQDRWLREMTAGDVFGEIAVLSDGRRTSTVDCVEPGELLSLSGDSFRSALTADAAVSSAALELKRQRLEA